jgi:hypothetical protein
METVVTQTAKLRSDFCVVMQKRVIGMSAPKYAETVSTLGIYNVKMVILLIMMDVIINAKLRSAGFVKEISNVDMINRTMESKFRT